MKDEIKEILEVNSKKYNVNLPKEVKEAFTCIDYELSVCSCELPKILDYITNLQEEVKFTEDYKDAYETTMIANKMLEEKYIDYKSRNEKAREYLSEVRKTPSYELDEKIDNLENILNGGDE